MDLKLAVLATFLSRMIHDVASLVTLGIISMVHLTDVVCITELGVEKQLPVKVRGSYLRVHAGLTVGWISRDIRRHCSMLMRQFGNFTCSTKGFIVMLEFWDCTSLKPEFT